jgi:phage shock protein A
LLSNNNYERLAREALHRREIELERMNTIQKQFDTQSVATDQLYNAIVTLENQIRDVLSKQEQLVSRARTAEATKQIQSMISGIDTTNIAAAVSNSVNAFTRMEQKIEAMEAAVEASIELNQMSWSSASSVNSDIVDKKGSSKSLEEDFRILEQSTKIEQEMKLLKNRLSASSISGDGSSSVAAIEPAHGQSIFEERRILSIPVRSVENIYKL